MGSWDIHLQEVSYSTCQFCSRSNNNNVSMDNARHHLMKDLRETAIIPIGKMVVVFTMTNWCCRCLVMAFPLLAEAAPSPSPLSKHVKWSVD